MSNGNGQVTLVQKDVHTHIRTHTRVNDTLLQRKFNSGATIFKKREMAHGSVRKHDKSTQRRMFQQFQKWNLGMWRLTGGGGQYNDDSSSLAARRSLSRMAAS